MLNKIINWEKVFDHSLEFQNRKPTKWTFVEEFFDRTFYEKLYNSYPKWDDTWGGKIGFDKNSNYKIWNGKNPDDIPENYVEDKNFSKTWNEFYRYVGSDEFTSKMREFSGVPINKLRHFSFSYMRKRGFQLAHIHNTGPSTLIMMIYFSKNWKKGDPGGTFVSTEEDESTMIYEPYNLDNSVMIFQDGPNAGHGVRPIEKEVERKAVQVYLEEFSEKEGWSGNKKKQDLVEL